MCWIAELHTSLTSGNLVLDMTGQGTEALAFIRSCPKPDDRRNEHHNKRPWKEQGHGKQSILLSESRQEFRPVSGIVQYAIHGGMSGIGLYEYQDSLSERTLATIGAWIHGSDKDQRYLEAL